MYLAETSITLKLLGRGSSKLSEVKADLAIQRELAEPLIAGVTIDALGIQVISFGKEPWKHVNDSPSTVREGAYKWQE